MSAPLIAIPTYHLGPGRVGDWTGAYALPEPYVTALRREPVEPPAPLARLLDPLPDDPAALLEAIEEGIQ